MEHPRLVGRPGSRGDQIRSGRRQLALKSSIKKAGLACGVSERDIEVGYMLVPE